MTTTLLLLGGAFVLGLVWTIRSYHVFIDRVTAHVPASADAVLTIPFSDGLSSVIGRFKGDFGQALSAIRFNPSSTLVFFVDKNVDNGEYGWHLMTDAPIDEAVVPTSLYLTEIGHIRLISLYEPRLTTEAFKTSAHFSLIHRASGRGWVREGLILPIEQVHTSHNEPILPLYASFPHGALKLSIGNQFRGIRAQHELPGNLRQITTFPSSSVAYVSMDGIKKISLQALRKLDAPLLDAIYAAGKPTELVLSEDGDFAALIHHSNTLAPLLEAIEQPMLNWLQVLRPEEITRTLQDGSRMTELRLKTGSVSLEERVLPNGAILRTYTSDDGRHVSFIIYLDGRIWITNQLDLVSSLIMSPTESSYAETECEPTSIKPGGIFSPNFLENAPEDISGLSKKLGQFKTVSFRIEDSETGLFTICGYF